MNRRILRAFTLLEMLVSVVVLAFIVVLASQMTSGVLSTISHSAHQLDASESVRATVQTLREELSGAIASERRNRFLNLKLTASEDGLNLSVAVPRARTGELTRMGFVEHVVYEWDRQKRTLARAAYHSSRDPDLVRTTARSTSSEDETANITRLRVLTPAYRGGDPYEWIAMSFWDERLKQARRRPLLTNLSEWRIECFRTADIAREEPIINAWDDPDRLPIAMRVTFVVDARARVLTEGRATAGRRFTSLIALPGARPNP